MAPITSKEKIGLTDNKALISLTVGLVGLRVTVANFFENMADKPWSRWRQFGYTSIRYTVQKTLLTKC